MVKIIESESQRVYKVEYAYPYYDEYSDKSATFRSSKLVWASSPEEAIKKLEDMKDKIYNDDINMTDYPYDFEVVGSWDNMNDFKSKYPMSNIELVESSNKVYESDSFYDKYKYYVSISQETPNPTYTDYLRNEAKRSGIIPIWVSYKINPSNGRKYRDSYNWIYLLKNKDDYKILGNIADDAIGINYVMNGPFEFDKSLFGIPDKQEYLGSKITESDEDKVFVMYEYTAYPEDGIGADDFYPLFIMDATNESEAKKEMDDYNRKHRDEITRTHSYFYDIVTKEKAEEMFGDDSKYEEKYMPVKETYGWYPPEPGSEVPSWEPYYGEEDEEEEEKINVDPDILRKAFSKYYNNSSSYVNSAMRSFYKGELSNDYIISIIDKYGPEEEKLPFESCKMVEALEDDPEDAEQEFSSAKTSIKYSGGRLPVLFKLVKFNRGTVNLDYGGGAYDDVSEYLKNEYDVTNLVYDKYNRSSEHNKDVLNQVRKNGGADTVTCSNVLNVIKEPEARLAVIKNCKNYLKSGGTAYFTTWEGSGKGDEGTTKAGYQLNRKTNDYVSEIEQVFNNVVRKGKLIIAK